MSTRYLLVFFSAVLITIACGATAVWLVLQNPTLAEKLFYTVVSLFSMGVVAIIGLVRKLSCERRGGEEATPDDGSRTHRR